MSRRWILGLIALSMVACGQPARPIVARGEPAVAGERSTKGWELYSWRDDAGGWRFALLVGTNAIRPSAVVRAPEHALELASIERALARLAPGEEIVWPGPTVRHGDGAEDERFGMPDAATRARIEQLARARGLALEVAPPR